MGYRSLQRRSDAPGFFWAPPECITSTTVTLTGPEARHAFSVCRLRRGQMMTVCDGEGNAYDCEITRTASGEVAGTIIRVHRHLGEPSARVTIAAGIGKPQMFDWIVEKAVELGVAAIIPLRAARSQAGIGGPQTASRRVERWRRLALGAMKQSLRSLWPRVEDIAAPGDVAARIENYHCSWLADPEGGRLADRSFVPDRIMSVLLIVGPESGFTDDERTRFIDGGAVPVCLGARRLRAETAAMTSLTLVMQYLGEL